MVPRGEKAAVVHAGAGRRSTPLEGEIYRFLRCGHMLGSLLREILDESYLRARCPHPLTRVQFCLLKLISVNADLQASEVARYLGVSPAAITKNVDKLERLGLVIRTSSERDRRAILLSASDGGLRLVREFEEFKAGRVLAGGGEPESGGPGRGVRPAGEHLLRPLRGRRQRSRILPAVRWLLRAGVLPALCPGRLRLEPTLRAVHRNQPKGDGMTTRCPPDRTTNLESSPPERSRP